MCHMNGLPVAQEPPATTAIRSQILVADATKVIDELHLKNHQGRTCHKNTHSQQKKKKKKRTILITAQWCVHEQTLICMAHDQ